MNQPLAELYQRLILEHNAHPRNFGPLPDATHSATVHNPLCGDMVTLHLRWLGAEQPILAVRFEGEGCALSRAAASLLTLAVPGKTAAEAEKLATDLEAFLQPKAATAGIDAAAFGELAALQGVREFPSRVRCATLPFSALVSALHNKPLQ